MRGKIQLFMAILTLVILFGYSNPISSLSLENSKSNYQLTDITSKQLLQESHWTSVQHHAYATPSINEIDLTMLEASQISKSYVSLQMEPPTFEWDWDAVGSQRSLAYSFATVAYVYASDTVDAQSYQELLETNGFATDLITLPEITHGIFADYDLIMLADDTGWNNDWGVDDTQIAAILDSQKPILGLGEGGYAYFGQIELNIGATQPGNQGVHGNEGELVVVNETHQIFTAPNAIGGGTIQVYFDSRHVAIHFSSIPENVDLLGRVPSSEQYPMLLEDDKYLLWGFRESPENMTQTGKDLIINSVAYLCDVQYIDPIWINNNGDFSALGFPGSGTLNDPYRIEDVVIFDSEAPLIHIQDTTAYFIIRNVILDGIIGANNGIELWRVANGQITDNTIYNCLIGIHLLASDSNSITNNLIVDNQGDGIFIENSNNTTISHNTIANNGPETATSGSIALLAAGGIGHGIYLDPSTDNTISNNDIYNNKGNGVFLENSNLNTISTNAIHENGDFTSTMLLAAGGIGHGIYLDPSDENDITNNYVFSNVYVGIFLNESDSTLVSDNIVNQNGGSGIFLLDASDNTIDNNSIGGNGENAEILLAHAGRARSVLAAGGIGHGIYLDPSDNNTITNNDIYDNTASGICLEDSDDNTISGNNIFSNGESTVDLGLLSDNMLSILAAGGIGHGIYLDPSNNNEITDNIVSSNLWNGIVLNDSDHTLVSGNNVQQNGGSGVFLLSASDNTIDNNTIAGNVGATTGTLLTILSSQLPSALAAGGIGHGIYLDPSHNNTITNNIIADNGASGVCLEDSWDNEIAENTIFGNGGTSSTLKLLSERMPSMLAAGGIGHGIYLDPSGQNVIHNNTVYGNGASGVFLEDSSYNIISENTIHNNGGLQGLVSRSSISAFAAGGIGHGIYLDPSNYNTITDNIVFNNDEVGIFLNESDDTLISDNLVLDNGADGVLLLDSNENTVSDNIIGRNGGTSEINRARSTLAAGGIGHGIYLDPSDYNTITGNVVFNNAETGILLYDSDNTFISKNFVQQNGNSGVFLIDSANNVIDNNTITDNGVLSSSSARTHSILAAGGIGHGIYLDPSPSNSISNNIVSNNAGNGIFLNDSNYVHISENFVESNGVSGVFLMNSTFNIIDNNTIASNGAGTATAARARSILAAGGIGHGIYLDPSPNNTITNNIIDSNYGNGIFLEETDTTLSFRNNITNNGLYGINVTSGSDDNTIVLNNFVGNNEGGTSQASDDGFDNLFRYNHWADHNNTDADDNRLADDPYYIDGEANSSDSRSIAEIIDYSEHYLYPPEIVFPSYHDKIAETAIIIWNAAIDTFWDDVSYDLWYSPDAGKNWYIIAEDLAGTSYEWDLTGLKYGSRYKLRIVATCSEGLTATDESGKFEVFKVKNPKFPYPDSLAGIGVDALNLTSAVASTPATGWSLVILGLSMGVLIPLRRLKRNSKD
ncbi:MAG: right-handed parallel beta-helix repeat-containing protein [Candidatus Hodarchaeota archaeon]